jgi:large conductance mechanosensitive channel
MWQDFKEFIMRGNVLDLAIGVIIGAAFGSIVTSLVNDIIMPPIGLLLGQVDFSEIFLDISGQGYPTLAAAQEAGAATINIGVFLNTLINFLIIALVVFLIVRWFNRLTQAGKAEEAEEPTAEPEPSAEDLMLDELRAIRQALEAQPPTD